MQLRRYCCLLACMVVVLKGMCADSDAGEVLRPVAAAYTVEAGSAHLADTYLTPLKYSGQSFALGYERMQAMKFDPERWAMRLNFRVELDHTENPARNATMWYGGIDFSWGMLRRWRDVAPGLAVGAGGSAQLVAGCLYNARNGNNPASARGAVTVNLTGYIAWHTALGRLPVTLRYQPSLPVVGAFFSPDYGELYYEIYLGNRSGLVHCAWWGDYLAMENLLTADLQFGTTALRLGYRNNILSTKANNIVSRQISHCAVVGVSGEWISISSRRGLSTRARIISAIY